MAMTIETGNITKASTDAIVNAANSGLYEGAGVCGAIFGAVAASGGHQQLTQACREIGHCETGNAVITPSFGLPAGSIIHAVGPVWSGDKNPTESLSSDQMKNVNELVSTYRAILRVCRENNLTSVTIPAISTGIYGFPEDLAAAIAHQVCDAEADDVNVTLVGFNSDNTLVLMNSPSPRAKNLLAGVFE
jgi:O-acetyl-ADP-ribose deacetylase (regulator of RNase III)